DGSLGCTRHVVRDLCTQPLFCALPAQWGSFPLSGCVFHRGPILALPAASHAVGMPALPLPVSTVANLPPGPEPCRDTLDGSSPDCSPRRCFHPWRWPACRRSPWSTFS